MEAGHGSQRHRDESGSPQLPTSGQRPGPSGTRPSSARSRKSSTPSSDARGCGRALGTQLKYLSASSGGLSDAPGRPFLISRESNRLLGYESPAARTRAFINMHVLGRNTRIWKDVDEFWRERHMKATEQPGGDQISHGPDFRILSFSAGKRRCPGAPLGVVLVMMALATLFRCFDWFLPEGLRPEDIGMAEVYGMTMPKADNSTLAGSLTCMIGKRSNTYLDEG